MLKGNIILINIIYNEIVFNVLFLIYLWHEEQVDITKN